MLAFDEVYEGNKNLSFNFFFFFKFATPNYSLGLES